MIKNMKNFVFLLLTLFFSTSCSSTLAYSVLDLDQLLGNSEQLNATNQCLRTSLVFVVDTASFIIDRQMVPIRQIIRKIGNHLLDTRGDIFALVDASRIAVDDIVVSADSANASIRFFNKDNEASAESANSDDDQQQTPVKDSWMEVVDEFWYNAWIASSYTSMDGKPAASSLSFEQLQSVVDSTSKRLVRKHRGQHDDSSENEDEEAATTTATSPAADEEQKKEKKQHHNSLTVVIVVNKSPPESPFVSKKKHQDRNNKKTKHQPKHRLVDDVNGSDYETNEEQQYDNEAEGDVIDNGWDIVNDDDYDNDDNNNDEQDEDVDKIRRLVLCWDCPASDCSPSSVPFRRLRTLAGGSRLDVFCVPSDEINQHQSSYQETLIASNIAQSTCDNPVHCRWVIDRDERLGNFINAGDHHQLPTFEFAGALSRRVMPGCTFYAKCSLVAGYGSYQLFEELDRCPSGTFYSDVLANCVSHSASSSPCMPNFCTVDATIRRLMAEVETAIKPAEGTEKLDERTQSCLPLASLVGNCRAFTTCHPETNQTLVHCCPPGRSLLVGTCSCVHDDSCPKTTHCTPSEASDMTWAELYANQLQHNRHHHNDDDMTDSSWPLFLSLPPLSTSQSDKKNKKLGRVRLSKSSKRSHVPPVSIVGHPTDDVKDAGTVNDDDIIDSLVNKTRSLRLFFRGAKMKRARLSAGTIDGDDEDAATTTPTVVETEEPPKPFYCFDAATGQRRRGPIPNVDATDVWYVHDWINNEWIQQQCPVPTNFLANTCNCGTANN